MYRNITEQSSAVVPNAMHSKSVIHFLSFLPTFCRKVTIATFRENLRVHHILTQLNPSRYYAVYVMLRLNNISLPYDKLLINTKSKCTFGLNAYETHQDNHGSIIPNDILM